MNTEIELDVLYDSYQPSTAGTNHLLAYMKGLGELGVHCRVYYLYPDKKESRIGSLGNIEHIFLWERQKLFKDKYLCSLMSLFLFRREMMKERPIYVVGTSMFLPFICKRGFRVYHERTEHPEVSGTISGFVGKFLFNKYLKAIKKIDGLFVISNNLRQCFIDDYGVDSNKVHVVNMVVDAERFKGLKKQKSERYIAYCGTASNNKDGVDQLIRSFALTSKVHQDVKLMIIGKTPDSGQEFENKNLVKELGIEGKVVFTGIIPAEHMPQVLMNAEVLALDRPDNLQAKHGFPTKLGEYLLTGNPVVVTTVGDIPGFLKDGESAVFSKPDDPESFSSRLNWVLSHKEEGREIGKRGQEVAMKEFNYFIESQKLAKVIFGE